MKALLLDVALIAYFGSAALYLANLHVKHDRFARYAAALAVVGFAAQCARLISMIALRQSPFGTAYEAIILVALANVAVYLVVLARYRLASVGALAMPLALLYILVAASVARRNFEATALMSVWLKIHMAAIMLSMAAFALAFCCAVFYLVQNRLLKSKSLHGMFRRLPPLELADSLGRHLVAVGLPLLTLGILTAVVGVRLGLPQSAMAPSKTAAALLTWAIYGSYLLACRSVEWHGRRSQYILILGALAVAVTAALHKFT